jgi:hypothetical protein
MTTAKQLFDWFLLKDLAMVKLDGSGSWQNLSRGSMQKKYLTSHIAKSKIKLSCCRSSSF